MSVNSTANATQSAPRRRRTLGRSLAALLTAACAATAIAPLAIAQSLPGFVLFGGPEDRETLLSFRLDRGQEGWWDRYRLRIPAQDVAITQVVVSYPEYYDGQFDERIGRGMELRYNNRRNRESIPLKEVVWDRENRFVSLVTEEPIPANNKLEIVFHNVRNPRSGGMYNFNGRVFMPAGPDGTQASSRFVGTWLLTIN
ncbi:MAG: DUF2808 domain-containing protein [Cyanobacteria bacterium]|nr:DUF2808 domain-containing protein [Cyanobacteriota bacterium]